MGKPCNAATYREATRKLAASVNPKVLVEVDDGLHGFLAHQSRPFASSSCFGSSRRTPSATSGIS